MSDLERLVEFYLDLEGNEGREARYERLDALARIYVELERLATKDGFGPGAVTGWSMTISRNL
jgi:hypothetical protein